MRHFSQHWVWYAAGAGLLWYLWSQKTKADNALLQPSSTTVIDAPPAVSGLLPGLPGPGGIVGAQPPGPQDVSNIMFDRINDPRFNPFVRR